MLKPSQSFFQHPRNLRVLIIITFAGVCLIVYLIQTHAASNTIRSYPQEAGSMLARIEYDFNPQSSIPVFTICAPNLNLPQPDPAMVASGVLQTLDLSNHPRIIDRRSGATITIDARRLQPGQIIRIIPVLHTLTVLADEIQVLGDNSQPSVPGCIAPSFN